jgi:hypothetical protein
MEIRDPIHVFARLELDERYNQPQCATTGIRGPRRANPTVHPTIRIVRSIPSWVCSRPSWVRMMQART